MIKSDVTIIMLTGLYLVLSIGPFLLRRGCHLCPLNVIRKDTSPNRQIYQACQSALEDSLG